jgi:hypothetical protein
LKGHHVNFPLHDLEPRDFEELCFWLIRANEIDELGHANVYGRSGQDQHGIDAYSYHHGRDEYRVYQCKRYQKYTAQNLRDAVAALEAGPQAPAGTPVWLRQATTFVLCISVDFAGNKNLTDERNTQTPLMQARGLAFEVWDTNEISSKLRDKPAIVEEFFGIKGVEEFCPESISIPYLRGVKARALLNIPRPNWNPKASVSPSALLKARNRIVSLEGRDTELKAYRAWTNDPNPWDVQLITGAGGTGKTRLMLEFCTELKAKGWNAGFMDANTKRTTD